LILPVGNVGCGKTLLSRRFTRRGAVRVCHDEILSMMHGTSASYVGELRDVYHQVEEDVIGGALSRGLDVYVDRTNIDKATRERFLSIARFVSEKRVFRKLSPVTVAAIDFGPGNDRDLERRRRAPRGASPDRWAEVFEAFKERYQSPSVDEGIDEIVPVDNSKFKVFAFDFDGVIVGNEFPKTGAVNRRVVELMSRLWENPHFYIVVYTCRENRAEYTVTDDLHLEALKPYLIEAEEYLRENGIPFDAINENPFFPSGRKMFAHYYVDDRNATVEEIADLVGLGYDYNGAAFETTISKEIAKGHDE
jgi:hypothetical protein